MKQSRKTVILGVLIAVVELLALLSILCGVLKSGAANPVTDCTSSVFLGADAITDTDRASPSSLPASEVDTNAVADTNGGSETDSVAADTDRATDTVDPVSTEAAAPDTDTDTEGPSSSTADRAPVTTHTDETVQSAASSDVPSADGGTDEVSDAAPQPEQPRSYVLNTNSHVFHAPDCYHVKRMKAENRQDFDGTRDQVIGMGYSPCKSCKP